MPAHTTIPSNCSRFWRATAPANGCFQLTRRTLLLLLLKTRRGQTLYIIISIVLFFLPCCNLLFYIITHRKINCRKATSGREFDDVSPNMPPLFLHTIAIAIRFYGFFSFASFYISTVFFLSLRREYSFPLDRHIVVVIVSKCTDQLDRPYHEYFQDISVFRADTSLQFRLVLHLMTSDIHEVLGRAHLIRVPFKRSKTIVTTRR